MLRTLTVPALLALVLSGCAATERDAGARDAFAWYCRGACAEAAGDYAQAVAAYGRACDLDPEATEPAVAHARSLLATGEPSRALEELEGVIARSPRHVSALSYLSEITFRTGMWEKAVRYNALLLRERPDLMNPAHHLLVLLRRGDAAGEIRLVLRAAGSDPRASRYLVQTVAELDGS